MKKTMFAAGAGLVLLLGACTKDAGTGDYKKQTAEFINGKDLAAKAGIDFEDASCAEPSATAVGTTYQCTATETGTAVTWTFDVQITEKNGFTVTKGSSSDGRVLGGVTDTSATTTVAG
jgi:hypothetical protein